MIVPCPSPDGVLLTFRHEEGRPIEKPSRGGRISFAFVLMCWITFVSS